MYTYVCIYIYIYIYPSNSLLCGGPVSVDPVCPQPQGHQGDEKKKPKKQRQMKLQKQ